MNYDYDAVGNKVSLRQPETTTTYSYNAKGLPSQIKYKLKDGTLLENNLTYDALGNMVGKEGKHFFSLMCWEAHFLHRMPKERYSNTQSVIQEEN